jgi:hypothetical protein
MTRLRRLFEPVLSIGEYPGESELQRSGRRVVVVAFVVATVLSIPGDIQDLVRGYTWVAAIEFLTLVLTPFLILAIVVWSTDSPGRSTSRSWSCSPPF